MDKGGTWLVIQATGSRCWARRDITCRNTKRAWSRDQENFTAILARSLKKIPNASMSRIPRSAYSPTLRSLLKMAAKRPDVQRTSAAFDTSIGITARVTQPATFWHGVMRHRYIHLFRGAGDHKPRKLLLRLMCAARPDGLTSWSMRFRGTVPSST